VSQTGDYSIFAARSRCRVSLEFSTSLGKLRPTKRNPTSEKANLSRVFDRFGACALCNVCILYKLMGECG